MDKYNSIFDAAHKGDFELVSAKLEEDPNLLHQRDSVSILRMLLNFSGNDSF